MPGNRTVWLMRCCCAAVWLAAIAPMHLPAQTALMSVPSEGAAPIADVGLSIRSMVTEPGFFFGAGVQRSDNIQRTIDARQSGNILTLASQINLVSQGPRLQYDLLGDLEWNRYLNGGYSSKVLGFFDGKALLTIVPNTFEWNVQDTVNQLNADPFQAPTPDRFVTENYFSTGPRVTLRFAEAASLTLGAQYGRTSTDSTQTVRLSNATIPNVNLSSNRYEGTVRLEHAFSRRTRLSLNGRSERVEYDNKILNTDYTANNAYVAYETGGPRLSLLLDAGYTEVKLANRTDGSPTGRIQLTRRVSPMSTVVFTAVQELQDALELGRGERQAAPGAPLVIRPVEPAPTINRSVGASWIFQRGRNTFVLGGEGTDAHSNFDPIFNRRIAAGEVRYLRPLRPTLYIELRGTYLHERYRSVDIRDQEWRGDAALSYRPGPRHWLTVRYDYFNRRSSLDAASFRENRIGIAFVYRLM